ncbi:MAG: hypothetical protein Kow0077_05960 [Anaerolineae bacterium]
MSLLPRWFGFPLVVLYPARSGLVVLAVMTGLLLSGIGLGRAIPAPTFQLETGGCPQPCWQGFQLGDSEALDVLVAIQEGKLAEPETLVVSRPNSISQRMLIEWQTRAMPAYNVQMRFTRNILERIDLYPQEPVLLRDVLGIWGAPSHVICQNGFQFLTVQLYFFEGAVTVWAALPRRDRIMGEWQVSPSMEVTRITFAQMPQAMRGFPPAAFPWGGFVRANEKGVCY